MAARCWTMRRSTLVGAASSTGNNQLMRSAALASVLPILGDTSNFTNWAETWKVAALEMVGTTLNSVTVDTLGKAAELLHIPLQGSLPSFEIISVDVINPTVNDFEGADEILFLDLPKKTVLVLMLSRTRLSICVRIPFLLRIPVQTGSSSTSFNGGDGTL